MEKLAEKSHQQYMEMAQKEALKGQSLGEVPVGALLVIGNEVVARAHNCVQKNKNATAHAEIEVINQACKQKQSKYLPDATLYVTLEPCTMCAGAMAWTQIGCLVFGAYDEKKGYSCLAPSIFLPKTKIIGGINKERCAQMLRDFFQERRRKKREENFAKPKENG